MYSVLKLSIVISVRKNFAESVYQACGIWNLIQSFVTWAWLKWPVWFWTQGCTRGRHSDVKPQQPLRPEVSSDKGEIKHAEGREIIYQGPKSAEMLQKERPRCVFEICSQLSFISASIFFWCACDRWSLSRCVFVPVCFICAAKSWGGGHGGHREVTAGINYSLRNSCVSVCSCLCMCVFISLHVHSSDEPMTKLPQKVSASLAQALEKLDISKRGENEKKGTQTLTV